MLRRLLAASPSDLICFSQAFDAAPASVLASACKMGLEGVIAKRRSAPYRSSRSADWIKLKCSQRQEFVIGGYTGPQGARTGFGALLLGVHDAQGKLQYAGNVGTGFSQQTLKDLTQALLARPQSRSPFAANSKIDGQPHWVTAWLVAEVSFGEWTRAGRIRHAVFRGLRVDNPAGTVVREVPLRLPAAKAAISTPKNGSQPLSSRLHVTNPQRVIDASTGTSKLELVRYYGLVGELMIKHLAGRPVSLLRGPAGVGGALFFQKHAETEKLPGVRQLDPGLSVSHPPMIEVAGKQGLLWAAQWNVIEFHTLNAASVAFEQPDRMVFDLDPGEGVSWAQVQEAAQLMHAFLTQLGLPSFLKTSEIRPADELKLPAQGRAAAGLKPAELKMAAQLIGDMTAPWKSEDYSDKFGDAVQELVNRKLAAGETETVTPLEDTPVEAGTSKVLDLTALLAKSLAKHKPGSKPGSKLGSKAGSKPDNAASAGDDGVKKAASKATARTRA